MLPAKPGYHAPLPPKSGRPSGKCGVGPAFGCARPSTPVPTWRGSRKGPGSFASCCPTSGNPAAANRAATVREQSLTTALRLLRRQLAHVIIAIDLSIQSFFLAQPRALQRVQHHVIAFVAGVLVDHIVRIELVGHVDLPRLHPRPWIADGDIVAELVWRGAREPLDNHEGIRSGTTAADSNLAVEIGRFHDERVAFPMPARIAHVGTDVASHVWAPIRRNHPRFVDHLVADSHVTGPLHDLVAEVIKSRQHAGKKATRNAAAVNVEVFP